MFTPAPYVPTTAELSMIHMLGATDCVPVGMDLTKEPKPVKFADFSSPSQGQNSNGKKSTEKIYITIDMKNMHVDPVVGNIYGRVYLAPPKQGKADCTLKMSADTFEKISRKEISGFKAFMSRKVVMNGDLRTLHNFDNGVLGTYKVNINAAQLV